MFTPLLPRPCPLPLTSDGVANFRCNWKSPNSSLVRLTPVCVVSIKLSSIFHCTSPFCPCHLEKSLPSTSTTASEGAGAIKLKVLPGVTIGGFGRCGSCTCHLVPGTIGVSLYPSAAEPPIVPANAMPSERIQYVFMFRRLCL